MVLLELALAYTLGFKNSNEAIREHYKPSSNFEVVAQSGKTSVTLDRRVYKYILDDLKNRINGTIIAEAPYEDCESKNRYEFRVKPNKSPVALFIYNLNDGNLAEIIYWNADNERPLIIYYEPTASNFWNLESIERIDYDINNSSRQHMQEIIQEIGKCLKLHKQKQEKIEEEHRKKGLERKIEEKLYKYSIFRV